MTNNLFQDLLNAREALAAEREVELRRGLADVDARFQSLFQLLSASCAKAGHLFPAAPRLSVSDQLTNASLMAIGGLPRKPHSHCLICGGCADPDADPRCAKDMLGLSEWEKLRDFADASVRTAERQVDVLNRFTLTPEPVAVPVRASVSANADSRTMNLTLDTGPQFLTGRLSLDATKRLVKELQDALSFLEHRKNPPYGEG